MKVVFDTNVVIGGAGWRSESHLCLARMARRRLLAYATTDTLTELRETANELQAEGVLRPQAWTILHWYLSAVKLVEPAAVGKQRSRDFSDDAFLACALAAEAKVLVTWDNDLLALGKPFGIEILTPRSLLAGLALRQVR